MQVCKEATRADVLDFKNWLTNKEGNYDPGDPVNCLVCQYMKARGFKNTHFGGTEQLFYTHGRKGEVPVLLPKSIAEIAYGKNNTSLEKGFEMTYQAARKRADLVLKGMKA